MLTIAKVEPVPCKHCGRMPAIWVDDKYVVRFKPEKDGSGLRDYVDTKGHRIKFKIRCTGRMLEKKSEVCHKSRVFIRKKIDLAINDWNNYNMQKDEEETPNAQPVQEG